MFEKYEWKRKKWWKRIIWVEKGKMGEKRWKLGEKMDEKRWKNGEKRKKWEKKKEKWKKWDEKNGWKRFLKKKKTIGEKKSEKSEKMGAKMGKISVKGSRRRASNVRKEVKKYNVMRNQVNMNEPDTNDAWVGW